MKLIATGAMTGSKQAYEVRPRRDHRGVDLISDVLPFGRLWYTQPDDAVGYAKFYSRSHDAVIRLYDAAGNVIETHEHAGELKDWQIPVLRTCSRAAFTDIPSTGERNRLHGPI